MVARVGDQLGVFDDVRAVVEALGAKLGEGRTDVIDRADLVNVAVHRHVQAGLASELEDAGELGGRVVALVGVQAHADEHVLVGQRCLQRLEGRLGAHVAQEAQDQVGGQACLARLDDGAVVAADDSLDRNAARGVGLRIEEALGTHDTVSAGALKVGGGQIVEIVLILEDIHGRVVDGQEGREVVELVGGLHLLDRGLADVDAVLASECQLEIGLEGAFQVQVQLGLGQAERKVAGHVSAHVSSTDNGAGIAEQLSHATRPVLREAKYRTGTLRTPRFACQATGLRPAHPSGPMQADAAVPQ